MNNLMECNAAPAGRGARRRWSRRPPLSPRCEGLEERRLLSTVTAGSVDLSQVTAQPALDVSPLVTTAPTGLNPGQIRNAYGVSQIKFSNGTVGGYGQGQTIAIVTAYSDPNIVSDLSTFDRQFGLPDPYSFTVKNLGGSTVDAGWALETALDVEWAHTLAAGANIVLVEAASSSLSDLMNAVTYASQQPGVSVVSMSWGANEFWGESSLDSTFTTPAGHTGVTFVAASGDSGAWSGPSYPATSPNVLAVGGTTLSLSGTSYSSESGWSGSTGGFSGYDSRWRTYEPAPSYQVAAQAASGLNYGVRTTPDVAFNASPSSGVAVYSSVSYSGQSGWFQVGGTSAGAPAWAGLIAVADQGLALGGKGTLSGTQAMSQLYALPASDFHDVTTGSNGYSATAGYDLVTGRGSPIANLVISGLLAANGVSLGATASHAAAATVTTRSAAVSSTHFEVVATATSATTSGAGALTVLSPGGSSASVVQVGALVTTPAGSGSSSSAASALPAVAATGPGATSLTASSAAPAQAPTATPALPTRLAADDAPPRVPERPVDPKVPGATSTPVREAQQDAAAEVPAGDAPAPTQPVVPPLPALPDQPFDVAPPEFYDLALAGVAIGLDRRPSQRPPAPARVPAAPAEAPPEFSFSAAVGAGIVAAGGFRLVLGRSDRVRRRWSAFRCFG